MTFHTYDKIYMFVVLASLSIFFFHSMFHNILLGFVFLPHLRSCLYRALFRPPILS